MTTYKEIRGTNIEAVASDPSNPVEGQVWYNTTSNVVKGLIIDPGSWSSGGDMNQQRHYLAAGGIQTAAVAFGGTPGVNLTEMYNGTSWTEVNNLNTARERLAGCGATNTAALAFGGAPGVSAATEEWNAGPVTATITTD